MIHDGKYVILFNSFDSSGQLQTQNKMGTFSVSSGSITATEGLADGMLPQGPISNATELRILYGLNNGYYEVRYTQGFRARHLQKSSSGWHVKIKGIEGYHPLKRIQAPADMNGKNTYILDDGREIPQEYIEDSRIEGLDTPRPKKLTKAEQSDVEDHVKQVTLSREYFVPGLAGYSLDGQTVYIDSRMPRGFDGIETDQFLLVHEATEKALMDKLGFSYRHAHSLALKAERGAVERAGVDWFKYNKFMQHWIRQIGGAHQVPKDKRPPDLDPDRITHDHSIMDIVRHTLRKTVECLRKADFADRDFELLRDRTSNNDPTVTAEELTKLLHAGFARGDIHNTPFYVMRHQNHNSDHVHQLYGQALSTKDKGERRIALSRIAQFGKLDHRMSERLMDMVKKNKDDINTNLSEGVLGNLPKNKTLKSEYLDQLADMFKSSGDRHTLRYFDNHLEDVLKNPNVAPETVNRFANHPNPSVRRVIAESPKASDETIRNYIKQDRDRFVQQKATDEARGRGFYEDPEKVTTSFGSNKLREVRDWINQHGGAVNGKELEKVGYNLGTMGFGHLKSGTGMVTADAVQKQIDSLPQHTYAISHTRYGFDPHHEDYMNPDHPQNEEYSSLYVPIEDEDGEHTGEYALEDNVNPIDEQRHSEEPSKVFQVNLTPEKVNQMKQAGVWDTFKRMNEASRLSNHPAVPHVGLGWVRYTEKPNGVFIDEIQSDLGQSFVRQHAAQAKQAVQEGRMTPEQAAQSIEHAQKLYPEEHYNKIKEIAFGGKHPSEVLHEVFHQHLRNQGKAGVPVHIWSPEAKAKISLTHEDKAIPGHMQATYKQIPEKMGYKPAKYGELDTQTEHATPETKEQFFGQPTFKTTLRKSCRDKELQAFLDKWGHIFR